MIVINQAQGAKIRELTTSGDGTFVVTPLPPATYTITVEAQGFKKYTKTDIVLYAQERVGLPTIVMEVGSTGETVTVESNAVTLQTVSAERSGVITNNMMVDLGNLGPRVYRSAEDSCRNQRRHEQRQRHARRSERGAARRRGDDRYREQRDGPAAHQPRHHLGIQGDDQRPAGRIRARRGSQHHHRHQERDEAISTEPATSSSRTSG